jgi:hypothetical protein
MAHRIIETPEALEDWFVLLRQRKLPMTVTAKDGRDRSLDQNALQWVWAAEAGNQLGETPDEVQRRWKLHHGVPILREDSEDFRQFYDRALKPLSYTLKLEAMRFVPVTSEMKVRQMVRFMDAIWKECGEQRIVLTDPEREQRKAA